MSQMMSVSSLNTQIKSLLEATFMHTLVEGEVASVTYHTSGHLYFSIKDDKSAIKCVMWRSSVARMKFRIEKGMQIVVEGSVSVYTPRGEYQFQTVRIEPSGQGALALAYEQLKERLKAKGYFEASRKKTLPKMPQHIALVTAKDSAALHDMLKIIQKRWALVEVSIVDTLVQGEMAAPQIANALAYADSLGVDVVVVGRGGGSAEDLWAFNEEVVADALFAMQTPVVSAVGHEVDTLISDFVADLRAPTPSAAMEMILPDQNEVLYVLDEQLEKFRTVLQHKIQMLSRTLKHQEEMFANLSPLQKMKHIEEQFKYLHQQFMQTMQQKLTHKSTALPNIEQQYKEMLLFSLAKREQELEYMLKKYELADPRKVCPSGWVKVSQDEKNVNISELNLENTFCLEDATGSIEVKYLGH